MKQLIVYISILCNFGVLFGMDSFGHGQYLSGYTTPKNDGTIPDDVFIYEDTIGGWAKETYDTFLYTLDETNSCDDVHANIIIKPSLFAQLCMQAYTEKTLDKIPFQELLHKIKTGAVDKDHYPIALTEKDAKHRLLRYIPKGKVYALVNNKKVRITIAEKIEKLSPLSQDEWLPDNLSKTVQQCRQQLTSAYNGVPFKYKDIVLYLRKGNLEIESDYNFKTQGDHHHNAVLSEFDDLLQLPDRRLVITLTPQPNFPSDPMTLIYSVFGASNCKPLIASMMAAVSDTKCIVIPRGRYYKMLIGTVQSIQQLKRGDCTHTDGRKTLNEVLNGLIAYLRKQYFKNQVAYKDYKCSVVIFAQAFGFPSEICNHIISFINPDDFKYVCPNIDALIMLRYAEIQTEGWAKYPNLVMKLPESVMNLYEKS